MAEFHWKSVLFRSAFWNRNKQNGKYKMKARKKSVDFFRAFYYF